jgi:hypothetical protein
MENFPRPEDLELTSSTRIKRHLLATEQEKSGPLRFRCRQFSLYLKFRQHTPGGE